MSRQRSHINKKKKEKNKNKEAQKDGSYGRRIKICIHVGFAYNGYRIRSLSTASTLFCYSSDVKQKESPLKVYPERKICKSMTRAVAEAEVEARSLWKIVVCFMGTARNLHDFMEIFVYFYRVNNERILLCLESIGCNWSENTNKRKLRLIFNGSKEESLSFRWGYLDLFLFLTKNLCRFCSAFIPWKITSKSASFIHIRYIF